MRRDAFGSRNHAPDLTAGQDFGMERRTAKGWAKIRKRRASRLLLALVPALVVALVVLTVDVRVRVNGARTYCGNAVTGPEAPAFQRVTPAFDAACHPAIRRWRIAGVGGAIGVFLVVAAVGEVTAP